jgi:hypothetical protein
MPAFGADCPQKRAVDIFAAILRATAEALTNRAVSHAEICDLPPDSIFKNSIVL